MAGDVGDGLLCIVFTDLVGWGDCAAALHALADSYAERFAASLDEVVVR